MGTNSTPTSLLMLQRQCICSGYVHTASTLPETLVHVTILHYNDKGAIANDDNIHVTQVVSLQLPIAVQYIATTVSSLAKHHHHCSRALALLMMSAT